ncbi:MAG: response regulator [Erysipelotrichales bacterium]|nr:response regulator [Erysipelotrichales bacterium]
MLLAFLQVIQTIGILVPVVGIVTLLRKDQNKTATYLMLSNVGCLILNGCYLLLLRSTGFEEAVLALKMQYLGNLLFYFFFVNFVVSYLHIKYPRTLMSVWAIFEAFELYLLWGDRHMNLVFESIKFIHQGQIDFNYLVTRPGTWIMIRNGYLSFTLFGLLIFTLILMLKSKIKTDRENLARLVGAEAIVITSTIITMLQYLPFDVSPICSSLSVYMIIISVIKDEFFGLADYGKELILDHIEGAFIITDTKYCFLDANLHAKKLFPELLIWPVRSRLRGDLYELFTSSITEVVWNNRHYEKVITQIGQNDKIKGYCLALIDVTKQHQLMEELIVEKERAEQANKAKSIFMSNMSHEIRTPMNAVVGMTDILLRSDLDEQDRGYLMNIKSSGEALLTIINDILDFSKIESGKMDLVNTEYEPMSMLNDLGMIFLNRIGNKPIELLFDIDKNLPEKLFGDSLRIRQIIINLMNNAVKFTDKGYVKLSLKVNSIDGDEIEFLVNVEDSGQGIKEEDKGGLFESFSQVDTKKNHGKEGTGLGLAISKQLVELMNGTIGLESEYGKGSNFYFTYKQKICSAKPIAVLDTNNELPTINVCLSKPYTTELFKKMALEYGVECLDYSKNNELADFIFVDNIMYSELSHELLPLIEKGTKICLLQNPMEDNLWDNRLIAINAPIYSINFCAVLNGKNVHVSNRKNDSMNFEAPDARVLIVDDNEMNLKVAKGLLEPLKLQIDTADNGKKAIDMIVKKRYDIVFMDHMMPIMDGVEATMALRNMDDEYFKNVPIIALTANAIVEAKESFKKAGMNDFVAKPIEVKQICATLRKWLPESYIHEKEVVQEKSIIEELPVIENLDVALGIKYSGSKELFMNLLGDYYKMIDMKSTKIEKCLADGLLRDYTIEVHALKNTSRMIGAIELSEKFYQLEMLGKEENVVQLKQETPAVLALYRSYKPILKEYGEIQDTDKNDVSMIELIEMLTVMNEAVNEFDLDTVDDVMKKLENSNLPQYCNDYMEQLRAYVADVAMMEIMDLTNEMIKRIKEEENV